MMVILAYVVPWAMYTNPPIEKSTEDNLDSNKSHTEPTFFFDKKQYQYYISNHELLPNRLEIPHIWDSHM